MNFVFIESNVLQYSGWRKGRKVVHIRNFNEWKGSLCQITAYFNAFISNGFDYSLYFPIHQYFHAFKKLQIHVDMCKCVTVLVDTHVCGVVQKYSVTIINIKLLDRYL